MISSPSTQLEGERRKEALKTLNLKKNSKKKGKTSSCADKPPTLPSSSETKKSGEEVEIEETMELDGTHEVKSQVTTECHILSPDTTKGTSLEIESLAGTLIRQLGKMMDARYAVIEDRLLPEKKIRPPLSIDTKQMVVKGIGGTTDPPPGKKAKGGKKPLAPNKNEAESQTPKNREITGSVAKAATVSLTPSRLQSLMLRLLEGEGRAAT